VSSSFPWRAKKASRADERRSNSGCGSPRAASGSTQFSSTDSALMLSASHLGRIHKVAGSSARAQYTLLGLRVLSAARFTNAVIPFSFMVIDGHASIRSAK
jgi:hypothetical protein